MEQRTIRHTAAVIALGLGLSVAGTANAWYGSPWYRPYGSGAMTYERQNLMRGHAYSMRELAAMFNGRRMFDRDEAIRLARELEADLGGELVKSYAPGTWVAGSRTAPWTWNNFAAFGGYAESAKQSAARLAVALEEAPSTQEVQSRGAWVTPLGMRPRPRGLPIDGLVAVDAIQEYSRLNATCHSCHASFRGRRW